MKKIIWLIPFTLAAFLRFVLLGHAPLNDQEAALALQALHVAQGARPVLGPEVAYTLPTAVLFWLTAALNWTARLWPALAGFSLVFVPWALRRELGERLAFLLALGLALDPFLTAASRTASGAAVAAAALIWGLAAFRKGRYFWAGAAWMLFLMSGVSFWLLALAALMAVLLLLNFALEQMQMTWEMGSYFWLISARRMPSLAWGAAALWALFAVLQPHALAAWLNALPVFLRGWVQPAALPPGLMLIGGLTYGILPIGLALAAYIWRRRHGQRDFYAAALGVLAFMLAFLVIFYPAHQPIDWLWVTLALWLPALRWLDARLPQQMDVSLPLLGTAALTLALLGFEWLQMLSVVVRFGGATQIISLGTFSWTLSERAAQLTVWLVGWMILVVSLMLIALTWGERVAVRGLAQGLLAALLIYTLGMAWSAAGTRTVQGFEFWQAEGKITGQPWLVQTVERIASQQMGNASALDVALLGVDAPSLRWALRRHHPREIAVLDSLSPPPIVISDSNQDLSAAAGYRGQVICWEKAPFWQQTGFFDWVRWMMLRQKAASPDTIIIWVREDLFLDTQNLH